jgi:ASC-1-like (ASCH) protein
MYLIRKFVAMTEHIAIMSHRTVLDKILSGQKTIESRFSRVKTVPFGQLNAGDVIYFKVSGGPILGKARVKAVEEYDNLTPQVIEQLADKYQKQLALSEDYLARKLESKFASLIFLEDIETCEPWNYKQGGRSGWIISAPGESLYKNGSE